MPDPTLLSIVLAALAGVLAAVKRLERADWVLPLPWVDLALAVAFAVTAGAFDDPAWWVAVVAFALGLFGFGFLAGIAALTLIRLPDPELMAMTVVPLLVGFALHHFLRAANGKQLPFEAAERDSARSDLRWSLAARIAPLVPFAFVLGVPLPGGDLTDTAVRLLGAAVIALYLVAVDRIRVALLRPRRRILRAAELNNALVATVLAASPIGAEAVAWWGRAPQPMGWEWYRLVAVVFSVFVVLAVVIGNNMVRGPLLVVVLALGHLARLAVATGLVFTAAIALFHPDRDLLVPAVIGGLPALVIGWLSIRRGMVFRQLADAALLSTLTESKRAAVIDTWVTEKVLVAAPDLSLPDAVGALALRSLADERAQPPWLVRTDEALAVADALLDAVDRRVARDGITDDQVDRARLAAR
ncbi:hypothetical protein [Actinokineospora terrae]|uniref:Uncharacterized protein n=1 Tax=Actinokineospora terrae TaxID=155974 RepID=A0A1H9V7D8_9PSEU|nr:hypothetical protein [Actinokineospora terrae]SES17625.1 hypothetical protein SAMN04487818_108121 [Actinokineospora terrae]